jgi:hypothetical protein
VPAVLLFAACGTTSTIESRLRDHPEVLAAATPQQVALAHRGFVDRGFSAELVLLVLEKPTRIATDATTGATLWYYHDIYGGLVSSVIGEVRPAEGGMGRARAEGRQPLQIDGSAPTAGSGTLDNYILLTLVEGVVTRVQIVRRP